MSLQPHLIAPFDGGGLVEYYKPWLIGEKAFAVLDDAYAWRGTVRKREGYSLLATLPTFPIQGLKTYYLNQGATTNEQLIGFSTTKAYLLVSTPAIQWNNISFFAYPTGLGTPVTGASFSFSGAVTDFFWTSNYASSLWATNNTSADGIKYWNGSPGVLNTSGGWSNFKPIVNGTPITLDGALIIMPYKARLVALGTIENGVRIFNRARFSQVGTPYAGAASTVNLATVTVGNPTAFTTATDVFTTGQNVSFFGLTGADAGLLNLQNAIVTRVGASSYTVPINTIGKVINNSGFAQQQGNPPSPFINDINAWRDDIPGKGGYIDADTNERIVSAAIIKDTLLVFFQNSTWRLRFTGNEVLPFIWERLNTQYVSESTFSTITFDENALTFSRRGFVGSDTNSVDRFDEKIPDQAFFKMKYGANAGTLQYIQGIRDYYRQTAYWCYTDTQSNAASGINNKVLAYNYIDKTWSRFNQPFRCFGYYKQFFDLQWQNATFSWSSANFAWQGDEQLQFPLVVAGDTANGNVYVVYDQTTDAQDMGGTVSVKNFNFDIRTSRFNPYIKEGTKAKLLYIDIYCTMNPGAEITVNHFIDDQNVPVISKPALLFQRGVYLISNIIPGAVTTTIVFTQPHAITNNNVITIGAIYGTIGNILNNHSYVATVVNATTVTIPVDTSTFVYASSGYSYQGVLPSNASANASYCRVFLGAIAKIHQIQLTLSNSQLTDPIKGTAQFELQGIVAWTRPEGRIRK